MSLAQFPQRSRLTTPLTSRSEEGAAAMDTAAPTESTRGEDEVYVVRGEASEGVLDICGHKEISAGAA